MKFSRPVKSLIRVPLRSNLVTFLASSIVISLGFSCSVCFKIAVFNPASLNGTYSVSAAFASTTKFTLGKIVVRASCKNGLPLRIHIPMTKLPTPNVVFLIAYFNCLSRLIFILDFPFFVHLQTGNFLQ